EAQQQARQRRLARAVLPSTATDSPGSTANETSTSAGWSARGYVNETCSKRMAPAALDGADSRGCDWRVAGSASSSAIRSALAAADEADVPRRPSPRTGE